MDELKTYESKVGERGQVTLAKPLREKAGIYPGTLVEQVLVEGGVLIRPRLGAFDGWRELAREVSGLWPSGVSAVDAIREVRGKSI